MLKLVCIFALNIFLFNCNGKTNETHHHQNWMEKHRTLALDEFLNLAGEDYKDLFSEKYELSEAVEKDSVIFNYIRNHNFLPSYIKRSLSERKEIFMMTVEELLLIKSSIHNDLKIVVPKSRPNEIHVGFKRFYNSSTNTFSGGKIWIFRYGFLWIYGIH